ncbi:hypothetical protein LTS09_018029, partial [Friedmanniomyces endolithicus]
ISKSRSTNSSTLPNTTKWSTPDMPDTLHGTTPASSSRPVPAMVEYLRERLNELDENIDLEDFDDCRRFHVEFGALTADEYYRLDVFMSSIPRDFPYDLTVPSQHANDHFVLCYRE